jgi:hypothetical protein
MEFLAIVLLFAGAALVILWPLMRPRGTPAAAEARMPSERRKGRIEPDADAALEAEIAAARRTDRCPNCGGLLPRAARFCPTCGAAAGTEVAP